LPAIEKKERVDKLRQIGNERHVKRAILLENGGFDVGEIREIRQHDVFLLLSLHL
jgi:hypothetical protein